MNFILKYSIVCFAFFAVIATASAQNTIPKNVLFIAVDDLKPILGCYGDKIIKTPNIDNLAAKGTLFMQNYCQQAICGPTRASLMTGKRPDYTKVWDLETKMRDINPNILTIPQYFKEKGYFTSGIGKIYDPRCVDSRALADEPSWSVRYNQVSNSYYHNGKPPVFYYYQSNEARQLPSTAVYKPSVECVDLPDNAYGDGAQTNRVLELLTDLSKNTQPFFFAVGFARPHLPFVAPKKYWDMYNREEMPLAPFRQHSLNGPKLAYTKSGELTDYTDIPPTLSTKVSVNQNIVVSDDKQKELMHGYYASVSYIDAQIGRILNKLDALGMRENTIIVLWGDHGFHLGDHDLWCKHSNFENATRAPLIISSPNFVSGKTSSPTEFVDVFPTLCDLAGLPVPDKLDGKSLTPMMLNPLAIVKDYSVSQYPRYQDKMGYSIRTKKYRMTWWMMDGFRSNHPFSSSMIVAKELYDYEKDPLETNNVASDNSYVQIATDMDNKMLDFFNVQRNTILGVGDVQEIKNKVEAYPNPSKEGVFSLSKTCNWKVYSVLGALLMSGNSNQVDLSEQPEGTYLLKISDLENFQTIKLIKK